MCMDFIKEGTFLVSASTWDADTQKSERHLIGVQIHQDYKGKGECVELIDEGRGTRHAPTPGVMFGALLHGPKHEEWFRELMSKSEEAHKNRSDKVRLETHVGKSGCKNIRIRSCTPEAEKYRTGGVISSGIHISCYGKLNEDIQPIPLADLWLYIQNLIDIESVGKGVDEQYKCLTLPKEEYDSIWGLE